MIEAGLPTSLLALALAFVPVVVPLAAPAKTAARGAAEARPGAPSPAAARPSAREILDRIDDLYRSSSSLGRMSMTVRTEHWTRELKLEFASKGQDRFLVRILSPAKEKGTATLKSGKDIWNYLPKVKRVIRVPSSMMGSSWMGSHFTNDDLVKESRMADDYTFAVTFAGRRGGREVIEITCLPKKDAAVVWGKVVATVRASDNLPLSLLFYDEGLKLARTMTFCDVRRLGGRLVPALTRMVPADKPEEATEIRYEEVAFDVPVDDGAFSIRSLTR